jgi:hypothetical protein
MVYDFALLLKQYLSDTKLYEAKRAGFSLASRVENQPFPTSQRISRYKIVRRIVWMLSQCLLFLLCVRTP